MFALVVYLCSILFGRFKLWNKRGDYELAPDYQSRQRKLLKLKLKIVSGYLHVPRTLKDLQMLIALNLIPDVRIDACLQNHFNECEYFLLCKQESPHESAHESAHEEDVQIDFIDLQNSKDWLCVPAHQ